METNFSGAFFSLHCAFLKDYIKIKALNSYQRVISIFHFDLVIIQS